MSLGKRISKKIKEAAKESSVEGITKVAKSENRFIRAIWFIFMLIATAYCFQIIAENLTEFFSNPVTTKMRYISEADILFPVIAFCNTNMITTAYGVEYFNNMTEKYFPNETRADDESQIDFLHRVYNLHRYDIQSTLKFNTPIDIQQRLGYNLSESLITCKYHGEDCDQADFLRYFNWNSGNCWMFDTSKRVYSKGPDGALTIELFTGFEKIAPAFLPTKGIQLMLLNRSADVYFNYYFESNPVKPSTETNFVLKRNFVNKLPYPYSDCTIDLRTNTIDSVDSSLYKGLLNSNITYSQYYCYVKAYRLNTYRKCGCVLEIGDVSGVTNLCTTNEEQACDAKSFNVDFIRNDFYGEFDKDCPLECNTMYYDVTQNSQNFPTNTYARRLLKTHPFFRQAAETVNLTEQDVMESILRVNIYYSEIGYASLDELATYTANDMIGGTGGVLSLFLGVSLISFVEIIELIVLIAISD